MLGELACSLMFKALINMDDEDVRKKTCRICLNDGDIPIFGVYNISKNINQFGIIHVRENDGFPQSICNECHELLDSAVQFSITAMASDKILRDATMRSGSDDETGNDDDHVTYTNSTVYEDNDDDHIITFTKSTIYKDFDDVDQESSKKDNQHPLSIDSHGPDFELNKEFSNDDSQESSDDTETDHKSNISKIYLEYGNTRDEDNSSCSSTKEEQQIDPKDLYMVIVSDKKKVVEYNCEICNLIFSTVHEANEHFATHEQDTCKKCDICNNIMETKVYQIHMNLHRAAFKQRSEKSKTKCQICGKMIGKSYMKFHMKMHGTNKDQSERVKHCPICDKNVGYRYFKGHMERIHGNSEKNTDRATEKTKKCPICDRLFKENIFEKHVARHGNNKKQYVCDQCGKVFNHNSPFQTHLLTHVGELKYKCEFCPYRGLHMGLLKVHVRTHTRDYEYKCSTCNKKFLTKSNLIIHEKRHTAIASFVCSQCKKGFTTQSKLDKHIDAIHLRIRNEKCEICGNTFGDRDGLMSHKNKIHNIKRSSRKGRLPNYLKAEQIKASTIDENDST